MRRLATTASVQVTIVLDAAKRAQQLSGKPAVHTCALNSDSGPLRAVLLQTDTAGRTPMHLATEQNAAMKVYVIAKV
jgi:hypothetical protein